MASFMTEDLSDELASSPVKLSAVERRPGRGQTQTMVGITRQRGTAAHPQSVLSFNPGRLLLCAPPPPLQGRAVLQAPLKAVNKGCEGSRMGLVLLFDCTWHAVIKWAIHPALPFSGSLRGSATLPVF